MKKKIVLIAVAILMLALFIGCVAGAQSADNSAKDSQRYALIKVYSAADRKLICEVEDEAVIAEFNQIATFSEDLSYDNMEDIKKKSEEYEPQYTIVSYKAPAAIHNDGTLEKISEITTYKDTNIIMMQVSPGTVKNFPVPSEYLTFYYEVSDEAIDFLASLMDNAEAVTGTSANQLAPIENMQDATQHHIGNPSIAKVEIYSGDQLIETIEEQEKCDEFQDKSAGAEKHYKQDEFTDALADLEPEYRFVAYQKSTSLRGDVEYMALFDLTVYQNSPIMKMYTPQEAVPLKFIILPEEERTLIYEARDDVLDYLYSLV